MTGKCVSVWVVSAAADIVLWVRVFLQTGNLPQQTYFVIKIYNYI